METLSDIVKPYLGEEMIHPGAFAPGWIISRARAKPRPRK